MAETNVAEAEAYYRAFNDQDLDGMSRRLHPEVRFVGPLAEMTGREAVTDGARRLMKVMRSITVRAKFGAGDQVMLAYDLDCIEPIGVVRVAALLTFKEGLILGIEIFFDARPFER